MISEAKARGNARDRPTEITTVGREGREEESTRHEHGSDASV